MKKVTLKANQAKEIELIGRAGSFTISAESSSFLRGAQRSDMGAPFSMARPQGYRDRVSQMWLCYDFDSGFKYLIDRLSHYGSNGFTFFSDAPKEVPFWDEWAHRVNEGVPGVIPGLREIIKWNIKHLSLGAMAYNNWQWGPMTIGKRTYQVPVKWTIQNQRSISISRQGSGFSDEKVGIYIEKQWLSEGDSNWALTYEIFNPKVGVLDPIVYPKDDKTWFLLKFNTSPGDNTRDDQKPQNSQAAASLYPTPPFYSLLPILKERAELRAMDLNIVDGFINKLVIWKVGNDKFPALPPVIDKDGKVIDPGTIATVQNLITKDNKGNVLQLFVPHWIDLDIRTPDINPLINEEKYMQPWVEMLWAFGILVRPEAGTDTFGDINTQNFEQLVSFYREEHVQAMLENVIFREIAKRNNLSNPEIRFNPINTISNEFLRNIREIAGLGKISTDTLLRFHKLDKKYELPTIMGELDQDQFKGKWEGWSEQEIFNTNTPVRFKQSVVTAEGTEEQQVLDKKTPGTPGTPATAAKKTQTQVGTAAPGRPKGKLDSTKRQAKGGK